MTRNRGQVGEIGHNADNAPCVQPLGTRPNRPANETMAMRRNGRCRLSQSHLRVSAAPLQSRRKTSWGKTGKGEKPEGRENRKENRR